MGYTGGRSRHTESKMNTLSLYVAVLAMVSCTFAADDKKAEPIKWQSNKVNETVTVEATTDVLIKNYDAEGDLHGSLRIALFGETVPMTVLNFQSICNGVKRPSGELAYSNGSQFFITFRSWQYLDGYHVGFGQVVGKESLEFLAKMNEIPVEDDGMTPKRKIKIVDCQAKEVKKYKIQRRAAAHEDSFDEFPTLDKDEYGK